MARAQFQKGQTVWVESVGAWAQIEKVQPVWAKGFDEPIRVTYDVGMGRDFQGHELTLPADDPVGLMGANWRMMRARNKWQTAEECARHPYPGTYPVVVTDKADWGGWRVPGAEYDRDPDHIEFQARLIASAPKLMGLAERMITVVDDNPDDAPPALMDMARRAKAVLQSILNAQASPTEKSEASGTQSRSKAA